MPRRLSQAQRQALRGWLNNLNRTIARWVHNHYDKKIQVSVQFTSDVQGVFRPDPCNIICYNYVRIKGKQFTCDASDYVMKAIAIRIFEANDRSDTLLYNCHGGITNIAIPYFDDTYHSQWYIFLGQFVGAMCNKEDKQICQHTCDVDNIRFLRNEEIVNIHAPYINPCESYDNKSYNPINGNGIPSEIPDIAKLTIHELAVSKAIAVDRLRAELGKKTLSEDIRKWIARDGKFKHSPSNEEIVEGINKNLHAIRGVFPNVTTEDIESVLNMPCLKNKDIRGLRGRVFELICMSREFGSEELDQTQEASVISYIGHLSDLGGLDKPFEQRVKKIYNNLQLNMDYIAASPHMGKKLKERALEILDLPGWDQDEIESSLGKIIRTNPNLISQIGDFKLAEGIQDSELKELDKNAEIFLKLMDELDLRSYHNGT